MLHHRWRHAFTSSVQALGHYTHEKNPLTARAALTTIEIIEDEGLVDSAAHLGKPIRPGFSLSGQTSHRIATRSPSVALPGV